MSRQDRQTTVGGQQRQTRMRMIAILSLLAVITACTVLAQHYVMTRLDVHQRRIEGFYMEEKNSLDIVFLGSSEIYNGIVPAKAWKDYGVTSYLYAYPSNPVTLWSYQLKEIERTQDPDLLVIECNGAKYEKENLDNPAEVRYMTDDMPFGKNKIQLVEEKGTEAKLSYYFPILKYHSHFIPGNGTKSKMLLERRGYSITRGYIARNEHKKIKKKEIRDVEGDRSTAELEPEAEQALRDFLEQCRQSKIKHIVFVRFPHVVANDKTYRSFQQYNRIGEIVREYGFEYIDFDHHNKDMKIKPKKDFVDKEHLNANGARKLTDFAVPYLMKKYQIHPRKHSDKTCRRWQESADYYDHLYEYWCYFKETYPDISNPDYDLSDSASSKRYIDAYYAGHPIDPADEQDSFIKRLKSRVREFIS